ncbi:hypothetical protein SUDANB13_03650 [Streptomyces sp. enrichment culture]
MPENAEDPAVGRRQGPGKRASGGQAAVVLVELPEEPDEDELEAESDDEELDDEDPEDFDDAGEELDEEPRLSLR